MRPTSQLPMGVGVLLLPSADGGVMAALDHGVTNKAQSPNKHGYDRTKLSCKKQKNIDAFPYLAMTGVNDADDVDDDASNKSGTLLSQDSGYGFGIILAVPTFIPRNDILLSFVPPFIGAASGIHSVFI
jgi:hypothetical protein